MIEYNHKKKGADNMAKYTVEVVMATCVTVEVEARDENEAQELAFEKVDPFEVDEWDYDVNCVYRNDDDDEEEE